MAKLSIHAITFVVAIFFLIDRSIGQEQNRGENPLGKFVAEYCTSCHGGDQAKSGLRLDSLAWKLDDKVTAETWIKVYDKLARGEMPPPEETQPTAAVKKQIIADLQQRLHAASLTKQQTGGRVNLRRLNRTEYETTLRDLLGPQLSVKDILPDDNTAAGFDNVSAVLDVSSTHLLRYQEAAEKAIYSVIPNRPQPKLHDRRTGKEIVEKTPLFKPMLGNSARVDGETLVMHVRPYGHIPCATATTPAAGRYRVRASVQAIGTEGKPLPVMFSIRQEYGRDDNDVRLVSDASADKPRIIEGEFEMKQRQVMVFNGWSLPSEREFQNRYKGMKLDDFAGPSLAVHWVEIEGPFDAWPSVGYQRLFGDVPLKPRSVAKAELEGRPAPQVANRPDNWWLGDPLVVAPSNPRADAERLLRSFLPIAFRRPVSEDDQQYFIQLTHDGLNKGMSFVDALTLGYKAILCSPHFLFLTERVDEAQRDRRTTLDDFAIASRLSYFLWSSLPDDELLALAGKRELSKPEIRRKQVERMLADPKARRFTQNFAGQWLDLRNINATSPDLQIYGEFDDFLFWSMPRETELFFEEVLRSDRSITEFVHSDWSFLNQRLAQHYGIPNVTGGEMRRMQLPSDSHRGGVLTQASIMKVTADGTRTSPVLRGKWVLEKILGQPPSPPPPDVPSIEPDIRGATTIREQLDKHRNTPACASCHVHIDPPGFALENFDVIGGWRDFYRATKPTRAGPIELANYPNRKIYRALDVEKGGQTPDGQPFRDIDEYKQWMLRDKDQLARNVVHKLIIYATGAEIQFADREVVEQIIAACRQKNYGFRSLVHEVVQSRAFLNK